MLLWGALASSAPGGSSHRPASDPARASLASAGVRAGPEPLLCVCGSGWMGSRVLRGLVLVAGKEMTALFSGCPGSEALCPGPETHPLFSRVRSEEGSASTLGTVEGALARSGVGQGQAAARCPLVKMTALFLLADSKPGRNPIVSSLSLAPTPALCPYI